ncbi:hypothetical protein [Paenibacillus ehimensis]|uniref:hypothetical protein n=1 Tax=Paenibacillus ehimensis TaxID=79264 RepID=UPI000FD7FAA3|nr:hypothetical protein [Paenibacillus ehimensis]
MFDLIPPPLKNFLDSIFDPPATFLNMVIQYLNSVSLVAGKGINVNNYFSFFGYLPAPLGQVLSSLMAAVIFLALLQIVKAIMRMYGQIKSWVKWW